MELPPCGVSLILGGILAKDVRILLTFINILFIL
jgi:hypothetical protein